MVAAAFLVQRPDTARFTKIGGTDTLIVFAADSNQAKSVAKGYYDGDGDAAWDAATVTQLAAATDLSDNWSLYVEVLDHATAAKFVADGSTFGITAGTIQAAGTGYSAADVLTVAIGTGTASRNATFRVTTVGGGGEVTGIELIDAGEYTATPDITANPVTGGGGTGAALDLTYDNYQFQNFCAMIVGLANAHADIAAAAVDFGEAGVGSTDKTLTVAAVSDGIGDENIAVEMRYNGESQSGFFGAITDGGVAGAALSVAITAAASRSVPQVVAALKS